MEIAIIKTTCTTEADMITIHTLAGNFVIKERLTHTDQPGQLIITSTRPFSPDDANMIIDDSAYLKIKDQNENATESK